MGERIWIRFTYYFGTFIAMRCCQRLCRNADRSSAGRGRSGDHTGALHRGPDVPLVRRLAADGGERASEKLSRLLSPILSRLFPKAWHDRETRAALSANVSANLLGLGSAATPMGIRAAVRMAEGRAEASDELCRLVVLNTASVQLIPATVAGIRAGLGSAAPLDILPAVWVTSFCSVAAGLLAAKVLSRWYS